MGRKCYCKFLLILRHCSSSDRHLLVRSLLPERCQPGLLACCRGIYKVLGCCSWRGVIFSENSELPPWIAEGKKVQRQGNFPKSQLLRALGFSLHFPSLWAPSIVMQLCKGLQDKQQRHQGSLFILFACPKTHPQYWNQKKNWSFSMLVLMYGNIHIF